LIFISLFFLILPDQSDTFKNVLVESLAKLNLNPTGTSAVPNRNDVYSGLSESKTTTRANQVDSLIKWRKLNAGTSCETKVMESGWMTFDAHATI
jgi:hypothetical protein